MSRPDQLDTLTNEIEQGFQQPGGYKACRYLLGRQFSEQAARIETLEAIVEELFKTKDGKSITPGMQLFLPTNDFTYKAVMTMHEEQDFSRSAYGFDESYSTRAAAEAAKEGTGT